MACGVPVVASDVGGMASHLRDRAWLVPRRDPDAMSRAFLSIYQSPETSQEKAGRQRAWIESDYSRDAAFGHWRDLFAEVAAENHRGRPR
jgi:glycosyltransferase involved in cell wall biosynthesis